MTGELYEVIAKLSGRLWKDASFVDDRHILLDLNPFVISPMGETAEYLLGQDISPLLDFRPIDKHGLILGGRPFVIPKSKEEVMLDPSLSLIEKRQLMRLMTLSREGASQSGGTGQDLPFLELVSKLAITSTTVINMIIYGIVGLKNSDEAVKLSVETVVAQTRRYAQSLERYRGATALLYPHGGTNSIIQAICRAAAVSGAVQILNQTDDQLEVCNTTISGCFEGRWWKTEFKESYLPPEPSLEKRESFIRTAVILEKGELGGIFGDEGCNYWIVPPDPSQGRKHTIFILQVDSAAACCPPGFILVYAWVRAGDDVAALDADDDLIGLLTRTLGQFINIDPEHHQAHLPRALLVASYRHCPTSLGGGLGRGKRDES